MINRLKGLGIVLAIFGFVFVAAGGFAFFKVQEGQASLQAFSAAQGVELGLALAGLFAGLGVTLIVTGGGLIWATRPVKEPVPVLRPAGVTI